MNHIFKISIIFLIFFVYIPSFEMNVKPRKSGARPKSDVRPLKDLRKAQKKHFPYDHFYDYFCVPDYI